MNLKWLSSIILLFVLKTSFSGQVLLEDGGLKLIGNQTESFEDVSGELKYKNIIQKLNDFIPVNSEVFFDYAKPSTYWFSFSMINRTQEDIWMDISNSNLTNITLYKFNEAYELIDSVVGGAIVLNKENKLGGYTFTTPLLLREEVENCHFLLSIRTSLVFEIPIFVGTVDQIVNNRNKFDFISLFVIGAFLLMFLYNCFLFFVTKDRVYIYYSFYLISAIVTGSYLNNFPFVQEIIGTTMAHVYLDTWLWTIFVSTGLFTIEYFGLKKEDPVFYKWVVALMVVFVLFGVLNLFVPLSYLANIYQVIAAFFYFVCLIFSYRLLLRGVKRAGLYCLGWTFMMTGAIIYIMVYNGWIPHNFVTRNVSYFGALCEVLIFSIALGRRITDLRNKQLRLNIRLKQKNKELLSVNDSLDSFNYHVSHDLKTVLNNTVALTRMAKKYNNKKDFDRVNEIVSKLETIASNGSETVQSFLSLGKVDDIINESNETVIDLEETLNKVLDRHNLVDQITIQVVKNQVGEMKIHPKVFESIFLNFITNSIKYTERAPIAKIHFLKDHDFINFEYEDNGIGIDLEKYQNDLFKPFQRVSNSLSKEGTGVGLYLVKRIVNGLDGRITVESELGKGTKFKVRLPK